MVLFRGIDRFRKIGREWIENRAYLFMQAYLSRWEGLHVVCRFCETFFQVGY